MASKYKESRTKEEIMSGEDYEIFPRELSRGQKDYSNMVIGDYQIIEPVRIDDFQSFLPILTPGWICKNTKTGYFKIIPNLALSKIYSKYCSDSKHFGVEYVSSDIIYKKLSLEGFKNEFLEEVEKEHLKRNDEYSNEKYLEYKREIDKYLMNVKVNIEFLKKLDAGKYENELKRIINKYHFVEVDDVSSFKHCLYLIALDEYKQFYVGKAENSLKNRLRKHWTAKTIPYRHLWNGGFDFSRIKFDDFKMLDSTRVFVCTDFLAVIEENNVEASDRRIEVTNTFGFEHFEEMNELAKAERIVINNSKCAYCLSDRTPLMTCPIYDKLEKHYCISRYELEIKHYLRLDEDNPYQAKL